MSINDFDDWILKNKNLWKRMYRACENGDNANLKICLDQLDLKQLTYYASRELMCRLFEMTMATKEYACLEQLLQLNAIVCGLDIGDVIDKYDLLYTAMRSACLEYLLGLSKLKHINKVSSFYSLLHIATFGNNVDAVKLLLKYGVNVNVKCNFERFTPLYHALKTHFDKPTPETSEIVKLLLMAGSSVIDLVGFSGFKDHRIAMLKLRIDAMCD